MRAPTAFVPNTVPLIRTTPRHSFIPCIPSSSRSKYSSSSSSTSPLTTTTTPPPPSVTTTITPPIFAPLSCPSTYCSPRLRRTSTQAVTTLQPPGSSDFSSSNSRNHNLIDTQPIPSSDYLFDDGVPFPERTDALVASGCLPAPVAQQLHGWYTSYIHAVTANPLFSSHPVEFTESLFRTLLELARQCSDCPIPFQSVHSQMRIPFDYYAFGFRFASALLDRERSSVMGLENIEQIVNYVTEKNASVVLLSNHQSEGDPYALDVLLRYFGNVPSDICKDIYFMAGDRVRDDPVVMPFSAGRNLLTVYSKKHINHQPELKESKMLHNKRTLSHAMSLFQRGGAIIWMAPSGGRDRRNADSGIVEISRFDEASIDMMKLTAMKSGASVHFFPMAIWSYDLLPPPTTLGGKEIGEERQANYTPMHLHIGPEIVWDAIPKQGDKQERRKAQRDFVQKAVQDGYRAIGGHIF